MKKVDEGAAVAKYNVTPVDTKWVDTDKAFEGEPMQLRSRIMAREFKSADRPDLHAGAPPLEALKAIISIAASHSPEFSLMHVDVSCAYFHARRLLRKGSRKNRIVDEEHVRYQRCSKQLGTRLARASRKLGPRAGAQCKKSVSRRRLRGGRIKGESVGAQESAGERVSNQSEHHRGRFGKEHQGVEPQNMLGRDRDIVPT